MFRAAVAEVDSELAGHLGWSVLAELRSPAPELYRTEIAQPLLFAVQLGLTALLRERGIRPAAVAGHSVGEVAAAYACGALDLAAACRVIAERGLAQAETAGGGRMAAVGLPADEVNGLIAGRDLELAGVNSPTDVTLSGSAGELSALGDELLRRGVFFRELNLDYAFHSRSMDPIRDRLCTALAGLAPRAGTAALVSTVTGGTLPGTELGAEYWWRNVREPVLFGPAVTALVDGHGCGTIVEIGPHPVLLGYLRRQCATVDRPVTTVARCPARRPVRPRCGPRVRRCSRPGPRSTGPPGSRCVAGWCRCPATRGSGSAMSTAPRTGGRRGRAPGRSRGIRCSATGCRAWSPPGRQRSSRRGTAGSATTGSAARW
ncbi:acyltransferase domain-containing protein [Streptomyces sp. RKCA744]|uniref:acyltransferase domain-containing protein n=1 Tax=Streptomyces sp. RKCA744 TaxID=2959340 RepID=UPI00209E2906|nr:acyltransferase domain-containing protein [Streptomyces sp. RKCA744]MCO8306781.1 acyltransferase domain-containing protein [Streptomyces sp. RKCA744]